MAHDEEQDARNRPAEAERPRDPGQETRPIDPRGVLGSISDRQEMRYAVREEDGMRVLTCRDAPEVRVVVERGATVSEATAKRARERTIFLDGAAQGPPFLDKERRVFNLDHHEGCVRSFTVATCEQALVLVLRGLELAGERWTVRAGNPDLDTVLAIWVLLNAMHLSEPGSSRRARIIPLVRLESVIDAHGLDLQELTGFSRETLERTGRTLESLREREIALEESEEWGNTDLPERTAELLHAVDLLVYPPDFFEPLDEVEILDRFSLGPDRLGIVCRSSRGIYEVEASLRKLYERRLGMIALRSGEQTYTLRQVDTFLSDDLTAVYDELNALDPAVAQGGTENRWGGSAEIGGSPRRTGTRLTHEEIATACRRAYRRPGRWERVARVAGAVGLSAGLFGFGWALQHTLRRFASPPSGWIPVIPVVGVLVAILLLLFLLARHLPRLYGLRRPSGREWLWSSPVALLAAVGGGLWVPPRISVPGLPPPELLLLLLLPVISELLLRGLAHGIVAQSFRVSHGGRSWMISVPTVTTALLSTVLGLFLFFLVGEGVPPSPDLEIRAGALFLFGLAAGAARERSGSLFAPLSLHLAGSLAVGFGLLPVLVS